ncbi:MAG: AI-2E family transporter [Alphaproteobacteria bacterium]|nr:AI-2E family transporter [Alphaproteobacteria bacterium]
MEGTDIPAESVSGGAVRTERAAPARPRSFVGGWAIAAVLAVIAVLIYEVRIALLPFVFAVAVAFVTDPLIRSLQLRLDTQRWPVAAVLYLIILLILAGAGYWIGTTAFGDLMSVVARAPDILHQFLSEAIGSHGITIFGQNYTPEKIVKALGGALQGMVGLDVLTRVGALAVSVIFGTFLTLVLMPYFMISAPRLAAGTIWLLPPERRKPVEDLLPRIVPILRRYLIGLVLVVLYTASVGWIGFGPVFHLPHAVLLAITVGVLELIPVIGPFLSATMVGIIAVQQSGLLSAGLVFGFAIALRLSIDNLVGPIVLGEAARIHPVVVIISFVCGAILFGVVGLLLAVPIAVCIKITLEQYYAEPIKRSG